MKYVAQACDSMNALRLQQSANNRRNRIMAETWESLFIKQANREGHSQPYIDECLRYKSALDARNMPIIFDVGHLACHIGWSENGLYYLLSHIDANYETYGIRKKSDPNSTRTITAPSASLKQVQWWVYNSLLTRDERISVYAQGFVERRGIKTNALPHEGAVWLLTLDLKDFFDNIYANRVYNYFVSLGYEAKVCWALTAICTYEGHLPQGAPTSPYLSNLLSREMDEEIAHYCAANGLVYSRYADDIAISSNARNRIPSVNEIRQIVEQNGFKLNHKKTKLQHKGQKMEVTGLTIGAGVHVPKSYRNEILRELHFCEKYTPTVHSQTMYPDKMFYKEWLLGRIQFVRSIDSDAGDKMLARFNKLNWIL